MSVKNRNFGGSGKPFSRRPSLPREEYSFEGKRIKSAAELEAYLSGKVIQCLICGDYFESVGGHVRHKHGITAVDYRVEFGIPPKTPLVTRALSKLFRENWQVNVGIDVRKHSTNSGDIQEDVRLYLKNRLKEFIAFTDECTSNKDGIYITNHNQANRIHAFAKRYKDKTLIDAITRNQEFTYNAIPAEIGVCPNKGCNNPTHRFGSHIKRNKSPACCSRECSREFMKSKRVEKACKKCGRIMLLTKANFRRISSCCGPKVNTEAGGSAIHFKDGN